MAEVYTDTNKIGKFYFKDPGLTILHRTDGPACEYFDGDKAWFLNGAKHRLDGPAVEYSEGGGVYFVDDWCLFNFNEGGKITSRM